MEPQIIVDRYPSEDDWTLSEFSINGVLQGFGVEDEHRDKKVHGETRIPNGIYPLGLRHSPKFSKEYYSDEQGYLNRTKTDRFNKIHEMIWVLDVPNFQWILWHWGNTDDSTNGCYIVGSNFHTFSGQKGVSGSRVKYTEVYPLIYQIIKKNKASGWGTLIEYRDKT